MKKGKKGCLMTILWIAVGAIVLFFLGNQLFRLLNKTQQSPANGFQIEATAQQEALWKQTPSDIPGLSQWDKLEQGMDLADGSDTDGDGLTDAAEIQLGSDPLKLSTAGDLYTDGFKVSIDVDPSEYLETPQVYFANNACQEVTLTADDPGDLYAVVTQLPSGTQLGSLEVLAGYRIYNYSGSVAVDLTSALTAAGLKTGDISVYLSDGSQLKSVGFRKDGNTVTLKKELENHLTYEICVVEKDFWAESSLKFGSVSSRPVEKEAVTGQGMVYCSPLICELFGSPLNVFYEDLGDPTSTQTVRDQVIDNLMTFFEHDQEEGWQHLKDDHIQAEHRLLLNLRYQVLTKMLPVFEISPYSKGTNKWYHAFFVYYFYDSAVSPPEETQPDQTDPVTGFSLTTDTLSFPNFLSHVATGGNCAGISHLTAKLYNTGAFEATGTYRSISWDLTGDSENATLLDRGLSDYKNDQFLTEHSSDGWHLDTELTAGEEQFINMLGACTLEGSYRVSEIYNTVYGRRMKLDYGVIEEMCRYLDSGKILDLYLWMNNNTGHTVNVYSYRQDPVDPDVLWFSVYDSAYPQNNTGTDSLSETGFAIKVTKKLALTGTGYQFDYCYDPLLNSDYGASSGNSHPLFIAMDENWNVVRPAQQAQPADPEETNPEENEQEENQRPQKCGICHYQIITTNQNRRVFIQCSWCKRLLEDPNLSLDHFADIFTGNYYLYRVDEIAGKPQFTNKGMASIPDHQRNEVKVKYQIYKAQDYAPYAINLLSQLNQFYVDHNLYAEKKFDVLELGIEPLSGLKDFKSGFDTAFELLENSDEYKNAVSKEAFMKTLVKNEKIRKTIEGGEKAEDLLDKAKAVVQICRLSKCRFENENEEDYNSRISNIQKTTDQFIKTVKSVLDASESYLLLDALYGPMLDSLDSTLDLYFEASIRYDDLLMVYDDHIDGELSTLFKAYPDTDSEISDLIFGMMNKQEAAYWSKPHMPTVAEIIDRLSGVNTLKGLQPRVQVLVVRYLEFRIHYEFEAYTGLTLEQYGNLIRQETTGWWLWEKDVLPWEKELDPDDYRSATKNWPDLKEK